MQHTQYWGKGEFSVKLFIVELLYFVLFLPLMMIPVVGWGILMALGNYMERLQKEAGIEDE